MNDTLDEAFKIEFARRMEREESKIKQSKEKSEDSLGRIEEVIRWTVDLMGEKLVDQNAAIDSAIAAVKALGYSPSRDDVHNAIKHSLFESYTPRARAEEQRFCRDCKYFNAYRYVSKGFDTFEGEVIPASMCVKFKNLVTGGLADAHQERSSIGRCGTEGKFFEARDFIVPVIWKGEMKMKQSDFPR